MARKKSNPDFALAEAALQLAASKSWRKLTLGQIARIAKISEAQIQNRYTDHNALLPLIVKMISNQSFSSVGKPEKTATPHDRLFEIMMARFDVLQKYRKGILSISGALRSDPRSMLILASTQIDAMKETLDKAQLIPRATCRTPASLALWGVFCITFHAWKNDETLDMSRTMAVLDRQLRYVHQIAIFLSVGSA